MLKNSRFFLATDCFRILSLNNLFRVFLYVRKLNTFHVKRMLSSLRKNSEVNFLCRCQTKYNGYHHLSVFDIFVAQLKLQYRCLQNGRLIASLQDLFINLFVFQLVCLTNNLQ